MNSILSSKTATEKVAEDKWDLFSEHHINVNVEEDMDISVNTSDVGLCCSCCLNGVESGRRTAGCNNEIECDNNKRSNQYYSDKRRNSTDDNSAGGFCVSSSGTCNNTAASSISTDLEQLDIPINYSLQKNKTNHRGSFNDISSSVKDVIEKGEEKMGLDCDHSLQDICDSSFPYTQSDNTRHNSVNKQPACLATQEETPVINGDYYIDMSSSHGKCCTANAIVTNNHILTSSRNSTTTSTNAVNTVIDNIEMNPYTSSPSFKSFQNANNKIGNYTSTTSTNTTMTTSISSCNAKNSSTTRTTVTNKKDKIINNSLQVSANQFNAHTNCCIMRSTMGEEADCVKEDNSSTIHDSGCEVEDLSNNSKSNSNCNNSTTTTSVHNSTPYTSATNSAATMEDFIIGGVMDWNSKSIDRVHNLVYHSIAGPTLHGFDLRMSSLMSSPSLVLENPGASIPESVDDPLLYSPSFICPSFAITSSGNNTTFSEISSESEEHDNSVTLDLSSRSCENKNYNTQQKLNPGDNNETLIKNTSSIYDDSLTSGLNSPNNKENINYEGDIGERNNDDGALKLSPLSMTSSSPAAESLYCDVNDDNKLVREADCMDFCVNDTNNTEGSRNLGFFCNEEVQKADLVSAGEMRRGNCTSSCINSDRNKANSNDNDGIIAQNLCNNEGCRCTAQRGVGEVTLSQSSLTNDNHALSSSSSSSTEETKAITELRECKFCSSIASSKCSTNNEDEKIIRPDCFCNNRSDSGNLNNTVESNVGNCKCYECDRYMVSGDSDDIENEGCLSDVVSPASSCPGESSSDEDSNSSLGLGASGEGSDNSAKGGDSNSATDANNSNCDTDINQHIWACFQQFNMAIACS